MTDTDLSRPITAEEMVAYPQALHVLATIASSFSSIVKTVDIPRLRHIAGYVETMGPLQEPTAWTRGGGKNVTDQLRFLTAVQDFLTALEKIK
jgi:hypothetical protein